MRVEKPMNQAYTRTQIPRIQARYNTHGKTNTFRRPGSAEALTVGQRDTGESKMRCRHCSKFHWSDECPKYRSVKARKACLVNSCFRCLKEGHTSRECRSGKRCVYCGEENTHHRSLCTKRFPSTDGEYTALVEESNPESVNHTVAEENALLATGEIVLMQTARTNIRHPRTTDETTVRLLLDSGSQRTYITERLAQELNLERQHEQELSLITFGSDRSKTFKTTLTTLKLKLTDNSYMTVKANIVPKITGTIQRKPVKCCEENSFKSLTQNLHLADSVPTEVQSDSIELLIGNDYYMDVLLPDRIEVKPGLYLLMSKLGWILSGRSSEADNEKEDISMLTFTTTNNVFKHQVYTNIDKCVETKPDLEDFWNIESIGIIDKKPLTDDDKALKAFRDTLEFRDNRYQVTWPWKESPPIIPENRQLALGRLRSIVTKLKKNPDLMSKYNDVIEDQLAKGVIEKVDRYRSDGVRHYIPHHAVIKPDKATTKVRIVYDASAKVNKEYKSLNECLYRGPVLLKDLCGILMRFRLHQIGIVSDIEKAFLQVGLQTNERDVTRFLWIKDIDAPVTHENIQEHRFCRVPFGVISSPFLLGATIEFHLESYNLPLADKLKNNIYMDNLITGTRKIEEAKTLYKFSKDVFMEASMNLREWSTSNEEVNNSIAENDKAEGEEISVLGHCWNTKRDTLHLKPVSMIECENVTKRTILKNIASVYDPLGLFAPVTLNGKLLVQDLWTKNMDWDDDILEGDKLLWEKIRTDIESIASYNIPRCMTIDSDTTENYLVCFCDASTKAYSTVVYLRQFDSDEDIRSEIVFAKTRLAPVKEITVPRLELLAVLIGVRCIQFVSNQLQIPICRKYVFTDSQCVLKWISSEKTLPIFVTNRLTEIKSHAHIQFRYVESKTNPSDVASRGCDANYHSQNQLWWCGPEWLMKPEKEWPSTIPPETEDRDTVVINTVGGYKGQQPTVVHTCLLESEDPPFGMDIARYSTFTRLIRVTALVMRFIHRIRRKQFCSNYLTSHELEKAEKVWIRHIQAKHFKDVFQAIRSETRNNLQRQLGIYIDDEGLLRCKGRLQNANLVEAARLPILLPAKDMLTDIIIQNIHKGLLHSGISHTLSQVRYKYWIPRGRSTVRSVLGNCITCRRFEGGSYRTPPMSNLPKTRVTEATPFTKVGIDYLGPVKLRSNNDTKKSWVCLFTCMVTRAVHLDIINDLSAPEFIMCLRRFFASRGKPSEIISDNAPHFKLANETIDILWTKVMKETDVQSYATNNGVKWTFIVELAPWMGGFYERLVGVVKRSLRKTIGRKMLSEMQFFTILKEVESVVNSRPLVYVGEDINSNITLSPNSFLCVNPNIHMPELIDQDVTYLPKESSAEKLLKLWQKGQKLLDTFWKIWRDEYLLSLRERGQTHLKTGRIHSAIAPKRGQIVIVKEDIARANWRLGRITDLVESADGEIRSAKVKLPSGRIIGRPMNLLYPLETSSESENVTRQDGLTDADDPVKCRPMRRAAVNASEKIRKCLLH